MITYNRKELLRKCLAALGAQLQGEDRILVVDNASTDGTSALLDAEFPSLDRLSLPENVGGSGGFYEGMKWAFDQGFDLLWLMDDDGIPAPDCLAKLRENSDSRTVAVPLQQDSGGRMYGISAWRKRVVDVTPDIVGQTEPVAGPFLFSFVGPLVPRAVVEAVGLPIREFFIWFDDYEYSLRIIERADLRVVAVPDALFFHDMGTNARVVRFLGWRSVRSDTSPWKTYYGIRNPLYTILHKRKESQGADAVLRGPRAPAPHGHRLRPGAMETGEDVASGLSRRRDGAAGEAGGAVAGERWALGVGRWALGVGRWALGVGVACPLP